MISGDFVLVLRFENFREHVAAADMLAYRSNGSTPWVGNSTLGVRKFSALADLSFAEFERYYRGRSVVLCSPPGYHIQTLAHSHRPTYTYTLIHSHLHT